MAVFWGLLIPFLGTTLGAGLVFLMKNKINKRKGFMIVKAEKVTTFIYTVIGKKIQ